MSWPQHRIDAMAGASQPMAIALRIGRQITGAGVGGTLLAASDPSLDPELALDAASLTAISTVLTAREWSYGSGAFSVVVVYPSVVTAGRVADIAARLRRGALVELLASAGGSAIGDYLRFGLGVLAGVRSVGSRALELRVYDLLYALHSRPYAELDASNLPQTRLFHNIAGTETTIASNYSAGASSLVLTSSANFSTVDGTGIARFVDNDGNTVYGTFTGVSGATLTGFSGGALGTSDADAASGNAAISSVYLNDHPLLIALKLLCSTGAASNGPYDVYPTQAGFSIDQSWIDLERFRTVKREILTPGSGSYSWKFAVDDPVPDGLLWLSSLLSESGAGLCIRQGQIAAWAAQTLASYQWSDFDITDADIDGFVICDWYDESAKFAYNKVQIDTATNNATSIQSVTTLPARDEIVYDLSELVRDNESAVRTMLAGKLADWCHYPPERLSLTLRGALWGLAVGDVGYITTTRARGRLASTSDGYSRRACMIAEYAPDPIAGTTAISLLITPDRPSDDYADN